MIHELPSHCTLKFAKLAVSFLPPPGSVKTHQITIISLLLPYPNIVISPKYLLSLNSIHFTPLHD